MAAATTKTRLGMSAATWDKIELISAALLVTITARSVMDLIGTKGLGGYGKSKALTKFSRMGIEKDTWSDVNVISTLLGAILLAKGAIDLVEDKTDWIKKEMIPGGLQWKGQELSGTGNRII